MAQLFKNNAVSTLASGILSGATSLTVATGQGARFPTITGSDYFYVTLYQRSGNAEINHEIVKVTARSGDVMTITRAQEGTTARAFNASDPVELRLTTAFLKSAVMSGYVGINVASPATVLDIAQESSANDYTLLRLSAATSEGFQVYGAMITSSGTCDGCVGMYIGTASGSGWNYQLNLVGLGAASDNFAILSLSNAQSSFAGSLGIGVYQPSYKLDIEGEPIRIAAGPSNGSGRIIMGRSTTATNNWSFGSEGDGTFKFFNGNWGAGSERFKLYSSGDIRVGFSNGNETLIRTGDILIRSNTDYQPQLQLQAYQTSAAGTYFVSKKSRGTIASPTAAANGDGIMNVLSQARNAAGTDKNVANISTSISEAESSNEFGSTITFATSKAGVGLTDRMFIDHNGNVGIGTAPTVTLHAYKSGASVQSYWDGAVDTEGYGAVFWHYDSLRTGQTEKRTAYMAFLKEGATATKRGCAITFMTVADSSNTQTERMRIDSSGNVGIGVSPAVGPLHLYASGNAAYYNRLENATDSTASGVVHELKIGTKVAHFYMRGASHSTPEWGLYTDLASSPFKIYNNGTVRLVVEADGRLYGTALHNNAGSVTGTTNQYIASGTGTPAVTGISNVSSSSGSVCQWMRVGNVVTVSGYASVNATAGGTTTLRIALPIASAFTTSEHLIGTALVASGTTLTDCVCYADATNDAAYFGYTAPASGARDLRYTYTYQVL